MKTWPAQLNSIHGHFRPWYWLPLLVLISLAWNLTDRVTVSAGELAIPLAALLGQRYGRRGLWVIALSCLLMPVGLQLLDGLGTGGRLDIYLVALLTCWLAGSDKDLTETAAALPGMRPSPWFFLAYLLLPISLVAGEFSPLDISLSLRFSALFYFFTFLAGTSGLSWRVFVPTLLVFTSIGALLEHTGLPESGAALFGGPEAELPLLGLVDLRSLRMEYELDSPVDFLAGLGWFITGYLVARLQTAAALDLPGWQSWGMVVLLAVVGLGGDLNYAALEALLDGESRYTLLLFGSMYALTAAALLGGLLQGWRGVLTVIALIGAFWLMQEVLRSAFEISHLRTEFSLNWPLAVLGFGVLGLALRDRALGTQTRWSTRWAVFTLILLLLSASFVAEAQSARELLWIALGFVGSLAIAVLVAWAYRRLFGWLPDHSGWNALLGLAVLTSLPWRVLHKSSSLNLDLDTFIIVSVSLIFAFVWLSTLLTLLSDLPQCRQDLENLGRALHRLWRPAVQPVAAMHSVESPPATDTRLELLGWVQRLRWTVFGAALISLLVPPLIDLLPQPGQEPIPADERVVARNEDSSESSQREHSRPNPYLFRAAREYLGSRPLLTNNPTEGVLRTDWYMVPTESGVRERIDIHVGSKLAPYALRIELRRQKLGLFGLWVEQGTYWNSGKSALVGESTYPLQRAAADTVMERAEALASSEES